MDGVEVAPSQSTGFMVEATVDTGLLDLFYSLLGISAIVEGRVRRETLAYASTIYDEIIDSLKDKIPEESLSLVRPPLADALEVADCLGPESLREVLEWAIYRLQGVPVEADIPLLEAYAECLGWDIGPIGVDEVVVAGGVLLSFTGSFNKYLARMA